MSPDPELSRSTGSLWPDFLKGCGLGLAVLVTFTLAAAALVALVVLVLPRLV